MESNYELTNEDLEVIGSVFDRLDAGQWMVDVYTWARRTFNAWRGDLDVIFDAYAGVETLPDVE